MKKFFAIIAIAGTLAACNSSSDSSKTGADSTAVAPADSSVTTMDSTGAMAPADSTKMDSTGAATADSAAKK